MAKTPNTKKEMDANISVKISSELLEKVRATTAATGVSASFVIRKALEEWVNQNNATSRKIND
jgi:predicted DNA binding CopG/RHH family protein